MNFIEFFQPDKLRGAKYDIEIKEDKPLILEPDRKYQLFNSFLYPKKTMVGIIVQVALSWLIIWSFEKKNLGVLGLYPTKKRFVHFTIFLLATAFLCASGFFMKMYFATQQWMINPALGLKLVWEGIWWNLKAVLFEELIFRGAILYVLVKRIGQTKAIIVSAIGFGIYHWFSQNAFGNPTQMVILFIMTGVMGLLLAYGYAKTFSLYIPIAIHFGWNYTKQSVFSEGPIGKQILIPVLPQPEVTVSYFVFFCILLLPIISVFAINYLMIKRIKQN